MDCPEGTLTMEKVREMMNFILPDENGGIVADLVFSWFEKANNGSPDFCEFIIATHWTANSSPEDKLHCVFQIYDKDGSGSITIGETIQVFAMIYENEGVDQKMAVDRAEQIFGNLDVNNDGDLTEEKFVKRCMAYGGWRDGQASQWHLCRSSSGERYKCLLNTNRHGHFGGLGLD